MTRQSEPSTKKDCHGHVELMAAEQRLSWARPWTCQTAGMNWMHGASLRTSDDRVVFHRRSLSIPSLLCLPPTASCTRNPTANSKAENLTRGGLTRIRAQKYASPHGGRHFGELHISAGITHHPNLNPECDAGFCWSLPETSKFNETSRTPAFSARTAAILMRH